MVGPYSNLVILTAALLVPPLLLRLAAPMLGGWARDPRRLGRIGLTLFLLMTSSAHFLGAERLVLMLPDWVPARLPIVYATGILEVALAGALWLPRRQRALGAAIALMLVAFLPANVYAAWNSLPFGGNVLGPDYLWVRVPYQAALIAWTLWATGWIGGAGRREPEPRSAPAQTT